MGSVKLSEAQVIVLRDIAGTKNGRDIRSLCEPYRQKAIDLGMMEPPLVDINGDWLFATPAGRAALKTKEPQG